MAVFSYSHRQGEYSYDIVIDEIRKGHFRARVINVTRRIYGDTVRVNTAVPEQEGPTLDEAVVNLHAAIAAWAKS